MPPHLHRRTPLRQQMSLRREFLLLPPHHPPPQARARRLPRHPLQLRVPPARGSLRHPGRHRHHPAAHRHRLPRLQTRRPPPLRPPDRLTQPPQTRRRPRRASRGDRHRRPEPDPRPHQRDHPTRKREIAGRNRHGTVPHACQRRTRRTRCPILDRRFHRRAGWGIEPTARQSSLRPPQNSLHSSHRRTTRRADQNAASSAIARIKSSGCGRIASSSSG